MAYDEGPNTHRLPPVLASSGIRLTLWGERQSGHQASGSKPVVPAMGWTSRCEQ